MNPAARNVIAVLAAVAAAYIALAIAATIDAAIGYPRNYSGMAGEVFIRLTVLGPFLVAAAVLGVVAAWIARPARRRPWLVIVGVLAAAIFAAAQRYIAPELQAWLETIVAAAIVGAVAACAFWLIARRTRTADAGRTRTSITRTAD